jgi:uncharacterized damage-inducible protein DinB
MDSLKERTVFTVEGVQKFHDWTHVCLNLLLEHLSTIPQDAYDKELAGFGFPTLRKQLIHIFNCEGLWINRLQGINYVDRNPAAFPAVADARLLQQEVIRQTRMYLSNLTDQQLNADTKLHFPDGDKAVRTPAFVLHHVFTHAFHHKGQIVAMCREMGHPAPDTDLSHFE